MCIYASVRAGEVRRRACDIHGIENEPHWLSRRADRHRRCDLRTIVLDVGTTNAVLNTALRNSSASAHLESIETQKDLTYQGYYREFHPFVLSLAGGLTERHAAKLSGPTLKWEPYYWAVQMLFRITAGMARAVEWDLTRLPPGETDDGSALRYAEVDGMRSLVCSRNGLESTFPLDPAMVEPGGADEWSAVPAGAGSDEAAAGSRSYEVAVEWRDEEPQGPAARPAAPAGAGGAEAPAGRWPGDIVMESGVEEPRRLGAQCECDVVMGGAPATSAAVA